MYNLYADGFVFSPCVWHFFVTVRFDLDERTLMVPISAKIKEVKGERNI